MKMIPLPETRNRTRIEDPHHIAAVKRGKAAVDDLQKRGILDSHGRRIRTDLPADMHEAQDRDFGG